MDCSLPGSSVHGISQARILEWVAISFSRGFFPIQGSNPGLLHWQAGSFAQSHQGSTIYICITTSILKIWNCSIIPKQGSFIPSCKVSSHSQQPLSKVEYLGAHFGCRKRKRESPLCSYVSRTRDLTAPVL